MLHLVRRGHHPAQTPGHHTEILGETVDYHGVRGVAQHGPGRLAIGQSVIDLVGDDLDVPATADLRQRRQTRRGDDCAGGVGRAGDQHPPGSGIQSFQRRGGKAIVALRSAGDLEHVQFEGADGIAIGHVARPGDGNGIPRRETGGERRHQGRRCPAGQQDPLRRNRQSVGLGIVAGDPDLQIRAFPVAHGIAVQHRMRPGQCCRRRAGGRLSELHVDDRPPLGLQGVGDAADAHGVEGIDGDGHGQTSFRTRFRAGTTERNAPRADRISCGTDT